MKQIPGFPGYLADRSGAIYSVIRRYSALKQLSIEVDNKGYPCVRLSTRPGKSKHMRVHKLILETFVGKCPPGLMARHLDDDKMNSALTNLCWGTSKENGADAVRNGKVVRGERNGKARLTADNVVKILAMTGTHKEVASEFGVSLGCIYNIRSGRTWKHVARDGR
jgi:hypothetical protein